MRPEASARELQAIESEYNLSRGNDATRGTQLVCVCVLYVCVCVLCVDVYGGFRR